MNHRQHVGRIVWWANHDSDEDKAWRMAADAGYRLLSPTALGNEYDVEYDGRAVAILRRELGGDWFAYVFEPERGAARWREALWRATHPFAARKFLPWPRRTHA